MKQDKHKFIMPGFLLWFPKVEGHSFSLSPPISWKENIGIIPRGYWKKESFCTRIVSFLSYSWGFLAGWVVNSLSVFQLPNKEVIREALPVHCPEWKKDNKQQEFVRKCILPENLWLLFWKELQNWKVQGSVDIMYFKLRQTLNIAIYEMRFARTNSQLDCNVVTSLGERVRILR